MLFFCPGAHRGDPVGGGEHVEPAAVVLAGDGAAGHPGAERNDPAAVGWACRSRRPLPSTCSITASSRPVSTRVRPSAVRVEPKRSMARPAESKVTVVSRGEGQRKVGRGSVSSCRAGSPRRRLQGSDRRRTRSSRRSSWRQAGAGRKASHGGTGSRRWAAVAGKRGGLGKRCAAKRRDRGYGLAQPNPR